MDVSTEHPRYRRRLRYNYARILEDIGWDEQVKSGSPVAAS